MARPGKVTHCADCGCNVMPRSAYKKLTKTERAEFLASGGAEHQGRGLCTRDYWKRTSAGTLDVRPRVDVDLMPLDEVLADWHLIKGDLPPGYQSDQVAAKRDEGVLFTEAERMRMAADRIGCSVHRLETALAAAPDHWWAA